MASGVFAVAPFCNSSLDTVLSLGYQGTVEEADWNTMDLTSVKVSKRAPQAYVKILSCTTPPTDDFAAA